MKLLDDKKNYSVFVLRMWQEKEADQEIGFTWRFSLEDPNTGERKGFTSMEALLDFLEQKTQLYRSTSR